MVQAANYSYKLPMHCHKVVLTCPIKILCEILFSDQPIEPNTVPNVAQKGPRLQHFPKMVWVLLKPDKWGSGIEAPGNLRPA